MTEIIKKYFPDLGEEQYELFGQLPALYEDWNAKINVVSRKDIDQLMVRHVLHSLCIAKLMPFLPYTKVLDLGTGGGFPGIPLAILFPRVDFHLVDSIGKKIMVVEEVVKALGLQNVKATQIRAEQLNSEYDFVVSRAVARSAKIVNWTNKLIIRDRSHELANGWLLLKGGDLKEELSELRLPKRSWELQSLIDEPLFAEKCIVHIAKR